MPWFLSWKSKLDRALDVVLWQLVTLHRRSWMCMYMNVHECTWMWMYMSNLKVLQALRPNNQWKCSPRGMVNDVCAVLLMLLWRSSVIALKYSVRKLNSSFHCCNSLARGCNYNGLFACQHCAVRHEGIGRFRSMCKLSWGQTSQWRLTALINGNPNRDWKWVYDGNDDGWSDAWWTWNEFAPVSWCLGQSDNYLGEAKTSAVKTVFARWQMWSSLWKAVVLSADLLHTLYVRPWLGVSPDWKKLSTQRKYIDFNHSGIQRIKPALITHLCTSKNCPESTVLDFGP